MTTACELEQNYCELEKNLRLDSYDLNQIANEMDRAALVGPPPNNAQLREWVQQLSDLADALTTRADLMELLVAAAEQPAAKDLQ